MGLIGANEEAVKKYNKTRFIFKLSIAYKEAREKDIGLEYLEKVDLLMINLLFIYLKITRVDQNLNSDLNSSNK